MRLWPSLGMCFVALAAFPVIAGAQPGPAVAQPPAAAPAPSDAPVAAEPPTEPPPGPPPSETPPPPPVPPEPPPAAPVLIPQPPVLAPVPPVFGAAPEQAPKLDVLLPAGASALALGAVFVLSGGITVGVGGDAGQYCGVTGCVDRVDQLPNNIGADLIGAGAGLAIVGGAGLLAWAADKPSGTEQRRSVPLLATGFSMTALSAAGLGLGIGQATTYDRNEADFSTAWPWFVASGVFASAGIPLLAVGATNDDDAERVEMAEEQRLLADPSVPKRKRSTGMVIGGAVLTGLGGLNALAGTGVVIADVAAGGPSFLTAIVGLPCLGAGLLFSSIGVPLLAVGNQRTVDRPTAGESEPIPEVTLGAGGLAAAWRLQ